MADRAKKARMPGTALRRPSSSGLRMRLRNLVRTPSMPVMKRERTISAMLMGMVIIMMIRFLIVFVCSISITHWWSCGLRVVLSSGSFAGSVIQCP